jgi:hypothetical protein
MKGAGSVCTANRRQVPSGFLMKENSLSKLQSLASPVRRGAGGGGDRATEDETSELSVVEKWAPTRSVGEGEDSDEDSGVEDSPYAPRLPGGVSTASTEPATFEHEDDDTSMSEFMIRVNTNTDLNAENPIAFFSASSRPASDSVITSSPGSDGLAERSPNRKNYSSASLRIQHAEVWLRQFVLPLAADEDKLMRLSAVGGSSQNLTPVKLQESKELSTLRFNVENTLLAVQALEMQLEQDLANVKPFLGEEEFLKVLSRCLNLRKQAMIACLQATQRAAGPQQGPS